MHVAILGEFGIVYKGYIKRSDSNSINEYLAIKTLKGTYDVHKHPTPSLSIVA
jgi:hypothetical protein